MEIRPITADEALAFRRTTRATFGTAETADDAQWAVAAAGDLTRARAAFDRGAVVATLRSFASELTVPGGRTLPAAALTAVSVLPTHRRRGVLTEMVAADLRESLERGEPVSVLIAAEYPIYGRFGYGPATLHTGWQLDAHAARFLTPGEGTVEFVDQTTLRSEAPGVFEVVRPARPGMIARSDRMWDLRLDVIREPEDKPEPGFGVVCRSDSGAVTGYATYKVNESWPDRRPRHTIEVGELVATTPAAEARLWRFLADTDLTATVIAEDRPADELLPWLLEDGRVARETSRADFLWSRVLDPVAVLQARAYWASGRVVMELVDPLGLAGGRFALEADRDGATCKATQEPAELTLPTAVLGATHLGGIRLATLAAAGRVDEHAPGALERADALLAGPVTPWCNTWF